MVVCLALPSALTALWTACMRATTSYEVDKALWHFTNYRANILANLHRLNFKLVFKYMGQVKESNCIHVYFTYIYRHLQPGQGCC